MVNKSKYYKKLVKLKSAVNLMEGAIESAVSNASPIKFIADINFVFINIHNILIYSLIH